MLQLNICPLCKSELVSDIYANYDFYCKAQSDDHFYGKRISVNYPEPIQIKIRFTENNGDKLFCRFNYLKDNIEVYVKKSGKYYDKIDKNIIKGAFIPDFSDIDKFKSKLKTYLLFG